MRTVSLAEAVYRSFFAVFAVPLFFANRNLVYLDFMLSPTVQELALRDSYIPIGDMQLPQVALAGPAPSRDLPVIA